MSLLESFKLDPVRIQTLAQHLKFLAYGPTPYRPLTALSVPDLERHLAHYIFFMVAVDHDTQRDGIRYESAIDGRALHGSDLLYALAERAKLEDPELFTPGGFARISDEVVERLFTTDEGVVPHDVTGRARIFRESAVELNTRYDGDVLKLIAAANDRAGGPEGLFARLARIPAYADPTSKKANLLRKLLKRAGLFRPTDVEAWDIASDHVVMTMALRSGLVRCDHAALYESLQTGSELDAAVIGRLRESAKQALKSLAQSAAVDVDDVDDLFWAYGRKSLRQPTPVPDVAAIASDLDGLVNPDARPPFIAALNGLDAGAPVAAKSIRVVRGPFTRDY